jgi:hypothetical protein
LNPLISFPTYPLIFLLFPSSLNEGFLAKAMTAASESVEGAAVSVEALLAGREVVGRILPIAFGLLGLQVFYYGRYLIIIIIVTFTNINIIIIVIIIVVFITGCTRPWALFRC